MIEVANFASFTCDLGVSPDEAVSNIEAATTDNSFSVGTYGITAGPPGTVVQISKGNLEAGGLMVVLVFLDGVEQVDLHANKAGAANSDDEHFVDFVIEAAPLAGCRTPTQG